jgi:hypothetical protein
MINWRKWFFIEWNCFDNTFKMIDLLFVFNELLFVIIIDNENKYITWYLIAYIINQENKEVKKTQDDLALRTGWGIGLWGSRYVLL